MRNYLLSLLCVAFVFTSCEVDESLNIDQKNPSEVPRVNYSTVSGAFSSSLPLESLSSIAARMVAESF